MQTESNQEKPQDQQSDRNGEVHVPSKNSEGLDTDKLADGSGNSKEGSVSDQGQENGEGSFDAG